MVVKYLAVSQISTWPLILPADGWRASPGERQLGAHVVGQPALEAVSLWGAQGSGSERTREVAWYTRALNWRRASAKVGRCLTRAVTKVSKGALFAGTIAATSAASA